MSHKRIKALTSRINDLEKEERAMARELAQAAAELERVLTGEEDERIKFGASHSQFVARLEVSLGEIQSAIANSNAALIEAEEADYV